MKNLRNCINEYLKRNVEGIIVYIHVDGRKKVLDVIDIRMMVKDEFLPSEYYSQIKTTKEEIEFIKEELEGKYLFSEKQYAQVLLLEIKK